MTKYILVTGGVLSSIGKGIVSATIGTLLKARGYSVSIMKFDPYINVDSGTLSPLQHGEVFVTDDGGETDLDLGHYERFTQQNQEALSSVTTGSIYKSVIDKERAGHYDGETVQVIPHVTDEIKRRVDLMAAQKVPDFLVVEVGGTVGDIESEPFIEAIRQYGQDTSHDCCYVHVTMTPWIKSSSELKTKPTQHSVKELSSAGIQPDVLVCRAENRIEEPTKNKLRKFCGVDNIISAPDLGSIYDVPMVLEEEGLPKAILKSVDSYNPKPDLEPWYQLSERKKECEDTLVIGIVGKYIKNKDAYLSLIEAIDHSCTYLGLDYIISWIDSEDFEQTEVIGVDGLVVPGGFGARGIDGKIEAIRIARELDIPTLCICVGMQCMVIDWARNVHSLDKANSSEFDSQTPHPVVDLLDDHDSKESIGGTLRLGLNPTNVYGRVSNIYESETIYERHRHRYEVNKEYESLMNKDGYTFSGLSPDGKRVEVLENTNNKFLIGTQFHPEFLSRPHKPHKLFNEFVNNCIDSREQD